MTLSQKIADYCQQPQIIVSYDLAIAKIALLLQLTESPKFDNLFINLGGFYIQMAFFKAIGKYIESSGITDISVDSQVLAAGSVNSFITAKHFNRCKRIHPLMSIALQSLLIEEFLNMNNIEPSTLTDNLKLVIQSNVECTQPPNLPEILKKYI